MFNAGLEWSNGFYGVSLAPSDLFSNPAWVPTEIKNRDNPDFFS